MHTDISHITTKFCSFGWFPIVKHLNNVVYRVFQIKSPKLKFGLSTLIYEKSSYEGKASIFSIIPHIYKQVKSIIPFLFSITIDL